VAGLAGSHRQVRNAGGQVQIRRRQPRRAPGKGGRQTDPPIPRTTWPYYAATAYVSPHTAETGLASFVLRNFDAGTWRSSAEGAAWLQGIELLTTGRITLPVPEPDRAYLRSIRRGERQPAEVLDDVAGAEARLTKLRKSTAIPDQPDRRCVDDWLHRS
jgi:hypothetical protein